MRQKNEKVKLLEREIEKGVSRLNTTIQSRQTANYSSC